MTEMESRLREIAQLQPPGSRIAKGVISPKQFHTKPSEPPRKRTPEEKRAMQKVNYERWRQRQKAATK